jgi:O-antigen ligase
MMGDTAKAVVCDGDGKRTSVIKNQTMVVARSFGQRARLSQIADWLVVGVAFSLPCSTSATSILIGLWLIVLLPTLRLPTLEPVLKTAAGGLPVLLFLLGLLGIAWASVPLVDRLHGAASFLRLLAIPLLIWQFRSSPRGRFCLIAFLLACGLLLMASYVIAVWPNLMPGHDYGVPTKNYISQSAEFTICAFALLYLAGEAWKVADVKRVVLLVLLSAAFLLNIFFIRSGRTTLVILPVILLIWAARQFDTKGAALALLGGLVVGGLVWVSSPYLRGRISNIAVEVQLYQKDNAATSAGERLEFWKKSIRFVSDAPLIGHGTGSIRMLFANAVVGNSGAAAEASTNPHNQTLTIAIQLGMIGVAVLWAMWAAHLWLFYDEGWLCWLGLLIVLQHIGGSLFNSYLFDFTEGWIYVFGVGVLGGMVQHLPKRVVRPIASHG